ncbi:unnamed protein product [Cuscuta campestris]|uniref:t-SNARE coiled-coil homology domain-containing protein n=1 Tax=Cuscuta campestris TaxID=132261 RepID=A0A484MU11_9ASTE|nr:unnamed protein product [Cuscuta campestris]
MNDLFSGSSPRRQRDNQSVEMTGTGGGVDLDQFFADVEVIDNDLRDLDQTRSLLCTSHDRSKTLHNARKLKDLAPLYLRLQRSRNWFRFEQFQADLRDLARLRRLAWQGPTPGPSSRLAWSCSHHLPDSFFEALSYRVKCELREKMAAEHRETVERRYYTVTGERAEEAVVDALISTGQSETFVQKAIGEQGRGEVMEAVAEIQERHAAVKEVERSLNELNQVFVDMAVLVERQGADLEGIESHVNRASSFVRGGTQNLQVARKRQRNTRKWACVGIAILLLIIFILVLSLQPWKKKKKKN